MYANFYNPRGLYRAEQTGCRHPWIPRTDNAWFSRFWVYFSLLLLLCIPRIGNQACLCVVCPVAGVALHPAALVIRYVRT
ncbi:hypothetical protein GQ53DRAFT_77847 [Thozetella sp. PMI_491]|nr:hypothetical protein GQ53DRAFT_77847 [Thozetella sp. PMI_491]